MSTYNELLQAAREFLKEHGVADAEVDAWYLLAHVTGMNRADFLMHRNEMFPDSYALSYDELIKKRSLHIPLQQLTGTAQFMGLEFIVSGDVLIPRFDTECLVEEVLKVSDGKEVLDMCTGSGCIIVSLKKLGGISKAVGTDISDKALDIAKRNAVKHNVNIEFIKSDLFDKIDGKFDIIVSNPPYIKTGELAALMPEVKDHEPVEALDAGPDGLIFYRRITAGLNEHLNKGGMVFYEIGYDQGEEVRDILEQEGFTDIRIKKDLSGLDRVVCGKRPL